MTRLLNLPFSQLDSHQDPIDYKAYHRNDLPQENSAVFILRLQQQHKSYCLLIPIVLVLDIQFPDLFLILQVVSHDSQ